MQGMVKRCPVSGKWYAVVSGHKFGYSEERIDAELALEDYEPVQQSVQHRTEQKSTRCLNLELSNEKTKLENAIAKQRRTNNLKSGQWMQSRRANNALVSTPEKRKVNTNKITPPKLKQAYNAIDELLAYM